MAAESPPVGASDGPSDGNAGFTGTWELLDAPAPVVVLPPRLTPWATAYCIPAATAGRRGRTTRKSVPGERTGFFHDKRGLALSTPSRPTPRPAPPGGRECGYDSLGGVIPSSRFFEGC